EGPEIEYHMTAITGPKGAELVDSDKMEPLFSAPTWLQGEAAPSKLNTLLWSFIAGTLLYGFIRLLHRTRDGTRVPRWLGKISALLVDEVMYRSVAIGFPVFTLGGLIFAAIWAQIAWDRFWGWDPKEVWALITWFFYAAFLPLRLSRGWHGEKSAWLAVIGFA